MKIGEENSIYASHQACFTPKLNELKGKQVCVFWPMYDDDAKGTTLPLCQEVFVNQISDDPLTVNVPWDSIPYVEGFEESS